MGSQGHEVLASTLVSTDPLEGSPVLMMDGWPRFSKSGIYGDTTLATAERKER